MCPKSALAQVSWPQCTKGHPANPGALTKLIRQIVKLGKANMARISWANYWRGVRYIEEYIEEEFQRSAEDL